MPPLFFPQAMPAGPGATGHDPAAESGGMAAALQIGAGFEYTLLWLMSRIEPAKAVSPLRSATALQKKLHVVAWFPDRATLF